MPLFLRKMAAQYRLENRPPGSWKDDDFAVVDDTVIGRIYLIEGQPRHHEWSWFLHVDGDRNEITLTGTEPSLDKAKEAIKAEYERWKARR